MEYLRPLIETSTTWGEALKFAIYSGGIFLPVLFAFSKNTRDEIRRRDRVCQANDGHPHQGILECAHLDHTRNEKYDLPESGELLCTYHHKIQHEQNVGHNGLSFSQNAWAINHLADRLRDYLETYKHEP